MEFGAIMELPTCLEDYEPDLVLTIDDRRKLIKGLAEDGTKSIESFINKHVSDHRSGITKLIQRLRSNLEFQIKRTRERIERKYKKCIEEIKYEQQQILEPVKLNSTSDVYSREIIDKEIDSRLIDILLKDDALNLIINLDPDQEEERLSIWSRLRLALRRFFRYISHLIRRFVDWLKVKFGRSKVTRLDKNVPQRRTNILLQYPAGKDLWDNIDNKLDNAIATSPDLKRTIDRDLQNAYKKSEASSNSLNWQKSKKKSPYEDQARKIINHRIKRAIKREQRRLMTNFKRKKRRLKKLQKDKKYQDRLKREHESHISQMKKQEEAELAKLKQRYKKQIQGTVKKALVSELEDAGYVQKSGAKDIKVTTRLIDRFAELVLSDELQKLPGKHSYAVGTIGNPHGIYEKRKLRMVAESSRMDIVDTMVNARLAHPKQRHIYDNDITTHADVQGTISHVILIFDKSGSMEENHRITAAKKAVLALYKAVKHRNQKNIVDFIAFDSNVHVMDILAAWQSSPSGFTNTGEALSTAYELIKGSRADNKLIYLITDGLPEAYTDPRTGEPKAGDLEKSLSVAISEAKKFRKITGLKLTIILLEPKEKLYTDAANTIAKAAGGSVMVTEPEELATEMLTSYIEI